MYKYILYIYKELFFVLILNGCPNAPRKLVSLSPFFFFKYSYLLNAVLTQSFLIFTSRGGKYFCFQGKWYNINLLMDW